MHPRIVVVLTLMAAHGAAIVAAPHLPDRLAAVVAGTVYLPLMPFDALGLAVFGAAASWGWASPSILGWCLLGVVWIGLWSALTCSLWALRIAWQRHTTGVN